MVHTTPSLGHVNPCFPVDGDVWVVLGDVALLEEECHWVRAWRAEGLALPGLCFSLLYVHSSRCELSAAVPAILPPLFFDGDGLFSPLQS